MSDLLNEAAALALTGLSRSTFQRLVKTGRFPAPLRPDGWHTLWVRSEVEDWLLARAVVSAGENFKALPAADLVLLARSVDPVLATRLFPSAAEF